MNDDYWLSVRENFQLAPDLIHMSCFWLSSHPTPVRELISKHRAELDINPYHYVVDNAERLDSISRQSLASLCCASPTQIGLTTSTTEGMSLLLSGMRLDSGDEILCSDKDHYSAYMGVEMLARRTGAHVRRACFYDIDAEFDANSIVESIRREISEKTKLFVLTWVHSSTGVRMPLEHIGAAVRAINSSRSEENRVFLAVDGTHGLGALRLDLGIAGCHAFVSSCHKWLCGPRGTGFLWLDNEFSKRIDEIIPTFATTEISRFMQQPVTTETTIGERFSPGGFCTFEHRWAISSAVTFLQEIGLEHVEGRILELATLLKKELIQINGVKVITPLEPSLSAGIVCFSVADLTPEEVVAALRHQGVVASVSPYPVRYTRLTPGIYNTEHEILMTVAKVRHLIGLQQAG